MHRIISAAAIVIAVAAAGCGSGDLTLDQADPEAVAAQPTWEQVYGIFQRECAPCHTDGDDGEDGEDEPDGNKLLVAGPDRIGGAEPDLTTCISIIENLDDSLGRIFDSNDMPPGAWPRLTSEERLIIQRWVEQGSGAPCN